ncbi:hypothetical protein AB7W67_22405, partial [Providencia rettgeri]|uniref:hypothetical protein n=1 Tax=Providencia stuartii TaxID=588 RepID=UPI0030F2DB98
SSKISPIASCSSLAANEKIVAMRRGSLVTYPAPAPWQFDVLSAMMTHLITLSLPLQTITPF